MKKRIIICVTYIAVVSIYVDAQNTGTLAPATSSENIVAIPPAPPVPPIPPLPPVPPPAPSVTIDGVELPNLPPLPPAPPIPPVPALEDMATLYPESVPLGAEIISNNGYEISVRLIKGKEMVIVKKDGKTQNIKLSTWNANRKYYEKKYGQLPPPPPPIPAVEI